MIIDPGLYSLHKSDVFWATEKRSVPTAFKLFTGELFLSTLSCYFCGSPFFQDPNSLVYVVKQTCYGSLLFGLASLTIENSILKNLYNAHLCCLNSGLLIKTTCNIKRLAF